MSPRSHRLWFLVSRSFNPQILSPSGPLLTFTDYRLARREWGELRVDQFRPVTFNDKAYDQLVLDADTKGASSPYYLALSTRLTLPQTSSGRSSNKIPERRGSARIPSVLARPVRSILPMQYLPSLPISSLVKVEDSSSFSTVVQESVRPSLSPSHPLR